MGFECCTYVVPELAACSVCVCKGRVCNADLSEGEELVYKQACMVKVCEMCIHVCIHVHIYVNACINACISEKNKCKHCSVNS